MPSLVAAKNTLSVLCTDYAEAAIEIAGASARYHGHQNFTTSIVDWTKMTARPKADVLLLSDVNYEPSVFQALQQVINGYLNDGTTILLSTPQRLMAKEFINYLLPFVVETEQINVEQKTDDVAISVFVLKKG